MQSLRVRRYSPSVLPVGLLLCAAIVVMFGALAGTGAAAGGAGGVGELQIQPQIACGDLHTVALQSDGSLWAWGYNVSGQLGLGGHDYAAHPTPTQVGTESNWVTVACGDDETTALKSDGSLWAWGYNGWGQLGLGDTGSQSSPTQVGTDTKWVTVACGRSVQNHTMALQTDGSLWAWGYNGFGQLGLNDTIDRNVPTRVGIEDDWTAVACGGYHTMALKSDGSLWAWGWNSSGELGLGDTTLRTSPTRVGTGNTWVAVACGYGYTVALQSDGSLWAWGWNGLGQLGLGDTTLRTSPTRVGTGNTWVAVACGGSHTVALESDGSLWAWGSNGAGQLGLGPHDGQAHPIPTRVGADTNWVTVACGQSHTAAFKSDGSLWTCGGNGDGELGLGDTTMRASPTEVSPIIMWLTSSTHPDQTVYYSDNAPALAWQVSDVTGVTGYSYLLDRSPLTVPDTTIDTTATSASFTGLADGVWYFHLRACSQRGIWRIPTSTYTIRIDTTPPTTAESGADDDWHNALVAVALTASDSNMPYASGLAYTSYSLDESTNWTAGTSPAVAAPADHSNDGIHTVRYYSADIAGNTEATQSVTVKIDTTPPITTDDAPAGWQNHDVTVTFTGTD